MEKKIPNGVSAIFKKQYNGLPYSVVYLGKYKDADTYGVNGLEGYDLGFPLVVQYKDGTTKELFGFDAVDILSVFVEY